MNTIFTAYRYFVFVLFIVCNIVLCSVSAWNLSIALAVQFTTSIEVDAVAIAMGAVGLVFILPILFIDVLRKQSVTRHVWFECLWVGVFALLEFAAAGAVTTTMSGMECVVSDNDGLIQLGPCISTRLMLAFSWTGAADMLFYLCVLAVVAILHQGDDPLVWKSNVGEYDWFSVRRSLGSAPPSPTQTGRRNALKSARSRLRTEFSKRMVVARERDLEKQAAPGSTTPPTAALPIQTDPATPRPSMERPRPSLDRPRPSLDRPRPSLDRPRPSLDKQRPSLDRPRPSVDRPRSPAPFTPRQFQLSAVPASPRSGAASGVVPNTAPRPSFERPPASFTPRPLQLSVSPPSATLAATPVSPGAAAGEQGSKKKRILRLHRPPSLDLSMITANR